MCDNIMDAIAAALNRSAELANEGNPEENGAFGLWDISCATSAVEAEKGEDWAALALKATVTGAWRESLVAVVVQCSIAPALERRPFAQNCQKRNADN